MFTSLYFDLKSFAMLSILHRHTLEEINQGWLCCANSSIDNDKLRLYYSIMDNDYDNLGLCWANTANDNKNYIWIGQILQIIMMNSVCVVLIWKR